MNPPDVIQLEVGEVRLAVPPSTPPEAVNTIEQLLAMVDKLAERTAQLHIALDSRIAIEQAKGILAHKHRISVDQAFDRLRRHARAHNQSLRKLAQAVVDGDVSL